MTKNWKKNLKLKKNYNFIIKKLQCTYPPIKDNQATGEALALKREYPEIQKLNFLT